jgi:hypothetical protein
LIGGTIADVAAKERITYDVVRGALHRQIAVLFFPVFYAPAPLSLPLSLLFPFQPDRVGHLFAGSGSKVRSELKLFHHFSKNRK